SALDLRLQQQSGANELFSISDEKQARAAALAGYGLGSILSQWGGQERESLPGAAQQELDQAFQAITTKRDIPLQDEAGHVFRTAEVVEGEVPLGNPIQVGGYRRFKLEDAIGISIGQTSTGTASVQSERSSESETYGGAESYIVPVGHAGMEVGYIYVWQNPMGHWESRLYDISAAPFSSSDQYAQFLGEPRDSEGYRTSSLGDLLSQQGEQGLVAEGPEAIARKAQELWYQRPASRIRPEDHGYLMVN
ncbi:MAG: hypothetical protein KDD62_02105, partial [Bdellovibrionales bacterium]|nr:hypothetical protein [Bdellovibrionales bacterium]